MSARLRALRRPLLCWAALAIIGASPALVAADADTYASREYHLKAAFLYNFTKFVEWPPGSFSDAGAPFVIGVMGADAFSTELKKAVSGRKVSGRDILVKSVYTAEDFSESHVVFVSATQTPQFVNLQSLATNRAVLSVGESPDFGRARGAINFVIEDNKVRFEIDMNAVERAGLRMSAQLQKLATVVRKAS